MPVAPSADDAEAIRQAVRRSQARLDRARGELAAAVDRWREDPDDRLRGSAVAFLEASLAYLTSGHERLELIARYERLELG